MILHTPNLLFFFFNDTATTEIYTLSLHDALPIFRRRASGRARAKRRPRFASWRLCAESPRQELLSARAVHTIAARVFHRSLFGAPRASSQKLRASGPPQRLSLESAAARRYPAR